MRISQTEKLKSTKIELIVKRTIQEYEGYHLLFSPFS